MSGERHAEHFLCILQGFGGKGDVEEVALLLITGEQGIDVLVRLPPPFFLCSLTPLPIRASQVVELLVQNWAVAPSASPTRSAETSAHQLFSPHFGQVSFLVFGVCPDKEKLFQVGWNTAWQRGQM